MRQVLVFVLTLTLIAPLAIAEEEKKPPKDLGSMTLVATPVETVEVPTATQKAQKKPIPVYLQPFEFIFSSIAHSLMFWKTGEELN